MLAAGGAGAFIFGLLILFTLLGGWRFVGKSQTQVQGEHRIRKELEPEALATINSLRDALRSGNQYRDISAVRTLATRHMASSLATPNGLNAHDAAVAGRYVVDRVLTRLIRQNPGDWDLDTWNLDSKKPSGFQPPPI